MKYEHDKYDSENYYGCDQQDDGSYLTCVILLGIMIGFAVLIIATDTFKEPSKGYGGSPGHMSPMEVEALYEKNKKN